MADASHDPAALYRASLERVTTAWDLWPAHLPEAFYLGGLAVECILQAIALRAGAAHDARHDLRLWVKRCPAALQDALNAPDRNGHWNLAAAEWASHFRYLDATALENQARHFIRWRCLRGDPEAKMRQFTKGFLTAAQAVHQRGIVVWLRDAK